MRLECAAKEKGCLGVVASVAISIGRVHLMVLYIYTQISSHACGREAERVSHAASDGVLGGGEPLVLAVEPCIHRWWGVLLVGWGYKSEVLEWGSTAIEECPPGCPARYSPCWCAGVSSRRHSPHPTRFHSRQSPSTAGVVPQSCSWCQRHVWLCTCVPVLANTAWLIP